MEECIFIHFHCFMRMTNEDNLNIFVLALEEDIEQDVKSFCKVFHVLSHRARHIHQTEHYGLSDWLWMFDRVVKTKIGFVQIWNSRCTSLQLGNFHLDPQPL